MTLLAVGWGGLAVGLLLGAILKAVTDRASGRDRTCRTCKGTGMAYHDGEPWRTRCEACSGIGRL